VQRRMRASSRRQRASPERFEPVANAAKQSRAGGTRRGSQRGTEATAQHESGRTRAVTAHRRGSDHEASLGGEGNGHDLDSVQSCEEDDDDHTEGNNDGRKKKNRNRKKSLKTSKKRKDARQEEDADYDQADEENDEEVVMSDCSEGLSNSVARMRKRRKGQDDSEAAPEGQRECSGEDLPDSGKDETMSAANSSLELECKDFTGKEFKVGSRFIGNMKNVGWTGCVAVESKPKDDPMFTKDNFLAGRRPQPGRPRVMSRVGRLEPRVIPFGSWVMTASPNSAQEWLLYDLGGTVCSGGFRSGDEKCECVCARHRGKEVAEKRAEELAALPKPRPTPTKKRRRSQDDGTSIKDRKKKSSSDTAGSQNDKSDIYVHPPMTLTQWNRETHGDVIPDDIEDLRERLQLHLAEVFREANLHGGQTNAGYSWMKDENLHRPAIQAAGQVLRSWYVTNKDRPTPCVPRFRENLSQPSSVKSRRRREREKLRMLRQQHRVEQQKRSEEGIPPSQPRARVGNDDLREGLELSQDSGQWICKVALLPGDSDRIPIAEFALADDAVQALEKAERAIFDQRLSMRTEKDSALMAQLNEKGQVASKCFVCGEGKKGGQQLLSCDLCIRTFHGPTCWEQQFAKDKIPVVDENREDATCSRCLLVLFQVAIGAAAGVMKAVESKKADRQRSSRRRADGGAVSSLTESYQSSSSSSSSRNGFMPVPQVSEFGFPISESHIKVHSSAMGRSNKIPRRKDGVDLSSNTQWIGEGYVDGTTRSRSRVLYTQFRFLDEPGTVFSLLDHVLLFRITPDGEEEVEDEDGDEEMPKVLMSPRGRKSPTSPRSMKTPDFYVGQIESVWEEPDGSRKARIAWFFWPEETNVEDATSSFEPGEVFSSNEVDVVMLSSIAKKIRIIDCKEFKGLSKEKGKEKASTGLVLEVPPVPETNGFGSPGTRSGQVPLQIGETGVEGDFDDMDVEVGAQLRNKYRDKVRAARTVLFARAHYHNRANKLLGADHHSLAKGTAQNPWMHSFIYATMQDPDTIRKLSEGDRNEENICPFTLGVADWKPNKNLEKLHEVKSIKEILRKAPRCSFCFEDMPFVGHFECAACSGVYFCFDCFSAGRQGLVKSAESGIKVLHRSSHPYKVAKPYLDYSNPKLAIEILAWMCKSYGLEPPSFEFACIVRGPLPTSELRGPSQRFRFGISLKYAEPIFSRHCKIGEISRVLGSRYGSSIIEAKGIAAIDALHAVFGVANKYSIPVLNSDWSALEALRLIDSLGMNGLAWEPAEEIVATKKALECANFFSCNLHPAWASQSEWAEALRQHYESKAIKQDSRLYIDGLPPPGPAAVQHYTMEAVEWGVKVHEMALRRSKVARRTRRGLAFASVNGQTVFAQRPESFAARVSEHTDAILRTGLDLNNLDSSEAFLAQEYVPPRTSAGKGAPCVVCKKTDRVDEMLLCDGCDSEFHLQCLNPPLDEVPSSDWFCDDCNDDREYIYDHTSWHKSGETLLHALEHSNDPQDERTQIWRKRVAEWADNDYVLTKASHKAMSMGFVAASNSSSAAASASPKKSSKSKAKTKTQTKSQEAPSSSKRKKFSSSSSSSSALSSVASSVAATTEVNPIIIPPSATPGEALALYVEQERRMSADHNKSKPVAFGDPEADPYLLSRVAWHTRHHAAQVVADLNASNHGLAEALSIVAAQRDALLKMFEKINAD